jgi:hypothetical protein
VSDLTLFGDGAAAPSPAARLSDPLTSADADRLVDRNERCRELLVAIAKNVVGRAAVDGVDGRYFTDGDLAEWVGEERNIVARRRCDLADVGLVEAVRATCNDEACDCHTKFIPKKRLGRRNRFEELHRLTAEGAARALRLTNA